ncbi:MAG: PLDc N-terminal domain-containing protein [Planctomycetia bacterium]|nr:PLDc N-terminal domain-containing protein [Planctomycetia bacterium]
MLQPTYAVLIGVTIIVLHALAIIAVTLGHGSTKHKLVWSAIILCLPVAGVILYWASGRSDADRPLSD